MLKKYILLITTAALILCLLFSINHKYHSSSTIKTSNKIYTDIIYCSNENLDSNNVKDKVIIEKISTNKYNLIIFKNNSAKIEHLLNFNLDNFSSNVCDINGDNINEFILYVIGDDTQDIYAYSIVKNKIVNIYSPALLKKNISIKKASKGYLINYGKHKIFYKTKQKLTLKFSFTDIYFDAQDVTFISEGEFLNSENKINTLFTTSYTINKSNELLISNFKFVKK